MAAIFQTTFSNAFSWMKMYKFRWEFHWSLFPGFQLTIFQHWFRYWLGADQATSHYLKQCWLVYWCIYASLALNELKYLWVIQHWGVSSCLRHEDIITSHVKLCLHAWLGKCFLRLGTSWFSWLFTWASQSLHKLKWTHENAWRACKLNYLESTSVIT